MRSARWIVIGVVVGLLCTLSGCGQFQRLFEQPQHQATEYESVNETSHAPQTTAVATVEESGSDASPKPVAPTPPVRTNSARDKQTQAIEESAGFFAGLATFLPPPWNVLVPSVITGGATWWVARRRQRPPKPTQA
jgi:hypothetical protein